MSPTMGFDYIVCALVIVGKKDVGIGLTLDYQ